MRKMPGATVIGCAKCDQQAHACTDRAHRADEHRAQWESRVEDWRLERLRHQQAAEAAEAHARDWQAKRDALAGEARKYEQDAADAAHRAARMEREAGDIEYTAPGGRVSENLDALRRGLQAEPGDAEEPRAGAGRPSARPATGDSTDPGPEGRPLRTGIRRTRPRGGRSRSRARRRRRGRRHCRRGTRDGADECFERSRRCRGRGERVPSRETQARCGDQAGRLC